MIFGTELIRGIIESLDVHFIMRVLIASSIVIVLCSPLACSQVLLLTLLITEELAL